MERDRSEELAKRMSKSLKSRGMSSTTDAAAVVADGDASDGAPPKPATNGSTVLGSDMGDEVGRVGWVAGNAMCCCCVRLVCVSATPALYACLMFEVTMAVR